MRIAICWICLLLMWSAPLLAADEPATGTEDPSVHWVGKGLSLYKSNYLLPLTWGNRSETRADAELQFQISFKQQVYDWPVYFAYTQKSFWRVLDTADSRPFRETNYNPEVFYRYPGRSRDLLSWGIDAGGEHESNGAREPESRSWNRLYLRPFVSYDRLRATLKVWYRWPESEKTGPQDTGGDENPDIYKYYGYGELSLGYMFKEGWLQEHMLNTRLRYNPATGKGAVQVDYSLPTPRRNAFWVAYLWNGYGESLIDYNRAITRFGLGVMLKR